MALNEVVFDFTIGNPAAPVPEKIKETITQIVSREDTKYGYTPALGYLKVRKKIAKYINTMYELGYSEENVIVTNGCAGGLNLVLSVLINQGDEVIVFKPYFSLYKLYTEAYGGKIIEINPRNNFMPKLEELNEKISEKTKAVIINSPNNPTGLIYGVNFLEELSKILKEKSNQVGHDIYILADEPYRELVYGKKEVPWIPKYYEYTFVLYSFSKTLSIAGERIGYLILPQRDSENEKLKNALSSAMVKTGCINAPSLFQQVVAECMDIRVDIDFYKKNKEAYIRIFKRLNFEFVEPEGAFYIFLKSPLSNCDEFVRIAKECGILIIDGKAFAWDGYVRVAFCCTYETIIESIPFWEVLAAKCADINTP